MKATFIATLCSMESNLWNLHIPVPNVIYQRFKAAGIKRMIVTYKGTVERPAAFMGKGDGSYFFMINKSEAKQLKLAVGDTFEVLVQEDKSTYGMPMPEEMEELLKQDTSANTIFHTLTPGVQRGILYIIGKPKSSAIRLEKAVITCEYLNSVGGAFDYSEFHEALKHNRFKRQS